MRAVTSSLGCVQLWMMPFMSRYSMSMEGATVPSILTLMSGKRSETQRKNCMRARGGSVSAVHNIVDSRVCDATANTQPQPRAKACQARSGALWSVMQQQRSRRAARFRRGTHARTHSVALPRP